MNLKIIASGSKANCYILSAGKDKLILDAGVRFSVLQQALDYDYSGVHGCLLSHEDGDHSRCVRELTQAGIEVFMSEGTMGELNVHGLYNLWLAIPKNKIHVGAFTVTPFLTQHDAAEPLGFLIKYRPTGETLVYATDTYYIKYVFNNVHAMLVECSYCTDALLQQHQDGEIDASLYKRLLTSHMSLENLKDYFTKSPPKHARKIVLCHLSDARSDEARMVREIGELTGVDTVAARDGLTVELAQF